MLHATLTRILATKTSSLTSFRIADENSWAVNFLRFPEKRDRTDAVGFESLFLLALLATGRGLRRRLQELPHPYPHHKSILSLAWLGIKIQTLLR